jgi:hypothetical protein
VIPIANIGQPREFVGKWQLKGKAGFELFGREIEIGKKYEMFWKIAPTSPLLADN